MRTILIVLVSVFVLACGGSASQVDMSSTNTPRPAQTPVPTKTPRPTNTAVYEAVLTPYPTLTLPTETDVPTRGAMTIKQDGIPTAVVTADALNLRAGPGVDYDVVGRLQRGDIVSIIGCNQLRDWVQVVTETGGGWAALRYLDYPGDVSVLTIVPAPELQLAQPTSTPVVRSSSFDPTPTRRPAADPTASIYAACICSRDAYNCDDAEAERCFEECKRLGAGDVHRLDRDKDGNACDW